jgi:hypothetical protein
VRARRSASAAWRCSDDRLRTTGLPRAPGALREAHSRVATLHGRVHVYVLASLGRSTHLGTRYHTRCSPRRASGTRRRRPRAGCGRTRCRDAVRCAVRRSRARSCASRAARATSSTRTASRHGRYCRTVLLLLLPTTTTATTTNTTTTTHTAAAAATTNLLLLLLLLLLLSRCAVAPQSDAPLPAAVDCACAAPARRPPASKDGSGCWSAACSDWAGPAGGIRERRARHDAR